MLCANDKVVVYIGASGFSGDIHDRENVETLMRDPGFGPPRGDGDGDDGYDGEGAGAYQASPDMPASRTSYDFVPDEVRSQPFSAHQHSSPPYMSGASMHARQPRQQQQQHDDQRYERDAHSREPTSDSLRGGSGGHDGYDDHDDAGATGAQRGGRSVSFRHRNAQRSEPLDNSRRSATTSDAAAAHARRADVFTGLIDASAHDVLDLVRAETEAQAAAEAGLGAGDRRRRNSAPDALEYGVQHALEVAHLTGAPGRGRAVERGGGLGDGPLAMSVPPAIRSSSVPPVSSFSDALGGFGGATFGSLTSAATPEVMITSKADALLQRLEQLEKRTRELDATGARTPGLGATGRNGSGRRMSVVTNQKMRRAVHKLVLINRFNKAALISPAPGASKASLRSGGSGGSGSTGTAMRSGLSGKSRSRWGFAGTRSRSIGKVMDQYIKEQSNLYEYTEVRKGNVKEDEKLPWYIIKPEAMWRVGWDMVMLVLVIYYSMLVPVRIGFDLETCEWRWARERGVGEFYAPVSGHTEGHGLVVSSSRQSYPIDLFFPEPSSFFPSLSPSPFPVLSPQPPTRSPSTTSPTSSSSSTLRSPS